MKLETRHVLSRRETTGASGAPDTGALERRLREALAGEVRFDSGSKALYATDSSNYRQIPIGVVIPATLDDVVATHAICAELGAPILARGCGTSLSGETVNHAVVMDFSKRLDAIGDPDAVARTITVEPGAINERVNLRTGPSGLVFAPDPSTHAYCTIGGNVGNNSCGIHSVQSQLYGPGPRTSDNVAALEVLTYDGARFWVGCDEEDDLERIIGEGGRRGEIYRALRDLRDRHADLIRAGYQPVDRLPRRVSGYNLDELLPERGFNVARALVGTEGTCVTVLQATLLLTPAMLERALVVVAFDDIADAGDHVPRVLEHRPIGLEGIDHTLFEDERHKNMHPSALSELPRSDGGAWLLVEFGADDSAEAKAQAERFVTAMRAEGIAEERISVFEDKGQERDLWEVREGGLGATAFPPDGRDHWPGWEDSAVPPERVGAYVRDLKRLYRKHGLRGAMYGHFGQGCIHSRIDFDLRTAGGLSAFRAFMEEAADLVVSYGGSLSGEHGDGQARAELLERQYGSELVEAMREFKAIWDPRGKMNPGKVVDAHRLDEDLKLGADYAPPVPATRFSYPEDGGSFPHATIRCVGVGKCRQPQGVDVMCPSFMVTREEKHTTRGRARLLFEMLEGDVVRDGWRSQEVKEALDLCLSCKGCTSDCPVHVDMPTYKAEFLHHHWKGRLRPRHAYALGLIDRAARAAALAPELVNALTHAPGLSAATKTIAGLTPERAIPRFAPLTLRRWFEARGERNAEGPRVLLFPDTFTNHLRTEVGVAAVEALEAAGCHVVMPRRPVCCGRPLYDYGFLGLAERYLRRVLDELRDEIRAGTPVIGIEPSCLATFRDELTKLLPHDEDAQRLRGCAIHFAEAFERLGLEPPRLERRALLWGHCHQKATGGIEPDQRLLERMGVQVEVLRGGCCGLAGSFGFERGHHGISMACGEQALLPGVRDAPADALVIADGFSCATQIAEGDTGRRALHLAQVMRMAAAHGPSGPGGTRPERAAASPPAPGLARRALRVSTPLAAMGLGAGLVARRLR
jgi:FAD/FMN-containing dehydrogenase/Fe-S oxidoreductase